METILETLRIGYSGGSFDKHRMEARQLAEVIKDVHKLLEIVNQEVCENSLEITLFVEAVEPGSLWENFKIEGSIDQLNQFFKDHPTIKVTLCLSLVMGIVFNGALKPEQLDRYKNIGDDILDRIEQAAQKKRTQNIVNKLAKPFNNNLTDESQLIIVGENTEFIAVKSENIRQALTCLPEAERDQISVDKHPGSLISIVRPDLKGGKKWDVSFSDSEGEGHDVTVIIEDLDFLAYMAKESVSVSRDHALYANVEERITKKAGNERYSHKWYITKVYTMRNVISGKTVYESPELKDL